MYAEFALMGFSQMVVDVPAGRGYGAEYVTEEQFVPVQFTHGCSSAPPCCRPVRLNKGTRRVAALALENCTATKALRRALRCAPGGSACLVVLPRYPVSTAKLAKALFRRMEGHRSLKRPHGSVTPKLSWL